MEKETSDSVEKDTKDLSTEQLAELQEDLLALKEIENNLCGSNTCAFQLEEYLSNLSFDELNSEQLKLKRATKLDFDRSILNRPKDKSEKTGIIMRRHTG